MERHLIRLTHDERWLLARRYEFFRNSSAALAKALVRETDGEASVKRLHGLRRVERRFAIDLGLLCHTIRRCRERRPHPLERLVIGYATMPSDGDDDGVLVDVGRVREVMGLIERGVKHGHA
ncbi:MAG: hypothetical protein ACREKI_07855 [Gemmatimonadota bacterium]